MKDDKRRKQKQPRRLSIKPQKGKIDNVLADVLKYLPPIILALAVFIHGFPA